MGQIETGNEYSYRYVEDGEGHPSIEVLLDGKRKTDFEKSWLSMNLEIKHLTLTKTLRSKPNETTTEIIDESETEQLSGEASLGEDSIGLIYTQRKTSKIGITFYEDQGEDSSPQMANKYFLSGYPEENERGQDSLPGTYFLNIFLGSARFNELKELVLTSGVGKIYVSVRTGVLPTLYNEFTTGEWPTVFRYLDNHKILKNPDDMPEKVIAKGIVRGSGYECEITFSRQPMFKAIADSVKRGNFQDEDFDADSEALHYKETPEKRDQTAPLTSQGMIQIELSKIALPIWVLVIIYALSQFFG